MRVFLTRALCDVLELVLVLLWPFELVWGAELAGDHCKTVLE